MQVSNKKKALAAGMIAVGGLALVGVGTGAVMTDTNTANMTVKAGTANLDIIQADGFLISPDKNTATLTGTQLFANSNDGGGGFIKVKNTGDISQSVTITHTETGDLASALSVTAAASNKNNATTFWLAPNEAADVSISIAPKNFNGGFTNDDSGKTATVSVSVTGTM